MRISQWYRFLGDCNNGLSVLLLALQSLYGIPPMPLNLRDVRIELENVNEFTRYELVILFVE